MGACATLGDCGRGVPLTPETQVARFCGADGGGQRWRRCEDRGGSGMGWGRAPGASIGTSKSGSNMCCVIHESAASADHESAASADNVGVALTARLHATAAPPYSAYSGRACVRACACMCARGCVQGLCAGSERGAGGQQWGGRIWQGGLQLFSENPIAMSCLTTAVSLSASPCTDQWPPASNETLFRFTAF